MEFTVWCPITFYFTLHALQEPKIQLFRIVLHCFKLFCRFLNKKTEHPLDCYKIVYKETDITWIQLAKNSAPSSLGNYCPPESKLHLIPEALDVFPISAQRDNNLAVLVFISL